MSKKDYLKLINKAKNEPEGWGPKSDFQTLRIGLLLLRVVRETPNTFTWNLSHDSFGELRSGSSENRSVARQEALAYAEHWVQKHIGLERVA